MSLNNCKFIDLPKISDVRGDLGFIESNKHAPFQIKRMFYLYGLKENVSRGAHAHKQLEQFLIAINGSFKVIDDDGIKKMEYQLASPSQGLYVPAMHWLEVIPEQENSILVVLCSEVYDEKDYYRDYNEFLKAVKTKP